jgi:hypothetical protein
MNVLYATAAALTLVVLPVATQAQNTNQNATAGTGLATGAVTGAIIGGPVGAVVGGAIGAIAGGAVAPPEAVRVQQYAVSQGTPSVRVRRPVVVGEPLPGRVALYTIPPSSGVQTGYRYTVVNERLVLVHPRTRRIVQVVR